MKKTLLILGMVVGLVGFMTVGAMATQISSISFVDNSGVSFNLNSLLFGTSSGAGIVSTSPLPTGIYTGLQGDPVTLYNVSYSASSVTPLWVVNGTSQFEFDATSVTLHFISLNNQVSLSGNGYILVNGVNEGSGTWNYTATSGAGETFSFNGSSSTSVPEPATLLLLGVALLGLGIIGLRWKGKA